MNLKSKTLFILLTFIGLSVHAQNFDPAIYQVGKKYPGYIIRMSGDTIFGFVEANLRCSPSGIGKSNQSHCIFYLSETDKKPEGKYTPKEIKEYLIADMVYRSLELTGIGKNMSFCVLVKDAHMSEYKHYITKDGYATMSKGSGESQEEFDARRFTINTYHHRPGIKAFMLDDLALGGFAKKLALAIADYPELAKKVADKEKGYRLDKFYDIIKEYNEYFAKKEEEKQ
jgi:hypothetical protein